MRRVHVLVALLAVLAACSGGDVTLEIDVLSFLNDGGDRPDPGADYAVPVPPTGVFVQGVPIVEATSFQLVDAIDEVTVVEEGQLNYRLEAVNREGSADARIRVRLAATREGLDEPGAALPEIDVALWPDSTTSAEGTVGLADTTVEVFANDRVWVEIEADLRVDPGQVLADSLAGRLWIRGLDVRIVAGEDFF
mgnify:CR=1 FL=1